MKNILKLSIGALAVSSMWAAPAFAEFSDVGTDYSKATVDRWSDDQINEFVEKANSFACVMSKSRPDLLPNASFEVLMSEVECGLAEETINASLVSNKDTLSSSVMKTSRASATSNQEGQFWFNSQTDMKFIGNIVIKNSAAAIPPYGEWSLSYYNNAFMFDTAGKDGDEFTAATTPISGYVDISPAAAATGGGVVMSSYQMDNMTRKASVCPGAGGCKQNSVMSSKIQYFDASLNSARILGRTVGTNDRGIAVDTMTAATTNATHIYKRVFAGGAQPSTGSESCTKRDSTWKTVHRYGVYNKSTGVKVSLNGGFGFDFTNGGTASRGFLSPHGAFFDDPTTAFTIAAPTKSVTAQNDAATPYTLSWAPGKLSERVPATETLPVDPDGDGNNNVTYFKKRIQTGADAEVRVVKAGATFKATYHNLTTGALYNDPFQGISDDGVVRKVASGGTNAGIDNHEQLGWMYSAEKRTMVYWDGSNTIKFYNDKNASVDATLLAGSSAGQYTKLIGTSNYSTSLASALPITAAAWMGTNTPWQYGEVANSINTKFYFTALTPPAGKLSRTLYLDVNPVGPSAGDKAVMFNFSANERTNKLTPFGSTTPATLINGNDEIQWPHKRLDLANVLANGSAGTTLYQWNTGAFGWDNSVIALKADNTVYTIDDPIVFDYAHTEAKDMNSGKVISFIQEYGNSHSPAPQLCGDPAGGARTQAVDNGAGGFMNVAVTECRVDPGDFDNKVFKLRYNGKWVDGLPDMEGRASENDKKGFRVTMVNPIAGTIVTNTVGSVTTNYVLKPLAVSESFLAEPTLSNCDTIDFDTYAEFGWDATDLPSSTFVPYPTQLWTAQPAKSGLKCTVNSGDASQCFE